MKVIIVEDEYHAVQRLQKLLAKLQPDLEVMAVLDSVRDTVAWLKANDHPDLAFFDIQLADGLSFSIFDEILLESPVIFTTAYDEYSLKAFKVNSIDYLLKPVEEDELKSALAKFMRLNQQQNPGAIESFNALMKNLSEPTLFKERFLIKLRDKYHFILADEVAYFYSEDSVTFLVSTAGKSFIVESTLNQLVKELDPKKFFRINRSQVVHVQSIEDIHTYFNNRLKLVLKPAAQQESLVSRDKVKEFKLWLGG